MTRKHRRRPGRESLQRRTPPGAPPGTVAVDPEAPRPIIRLMGYGPEAVTEREVRDLEDVRGFVGSHPVTWVNVDGLGDAATISRLGEIFGLHRLSLEDVVNVHQRAKVEQYPNYLFIVARMAQSGEKIDTEQLSVFLGTNFVLTFQEQYGDCFDPVRDRIRKGGGRIRGSGPDYLAYALLDAFIDNYFPVLEHLGERLEALEDEVIARPDRQTIAQIHQSKRDLLTLRRALWPMREAISSLFRDASSLIREETRIYLRDSYDHTVQLIDLIETYRELTGGLTDIYLSSLSNRLNEVMKLLTVFSATFIPLTFIAGIYGMNFDTDQSPWNMPELGWRWGYPFALMLMAVVAAVMLIFFRRKGWLGASGDEQEKGPPADSHGRR